MSIQKSHSPGEQIGSRCHGVRGRGTSRFRGVSWSKAASKWFAAFRMKGHVQCLGFFRDEEEAARAYDAAAREALGEFATLNFPDSVKSERTMMSRCEAHQLFGVSTQVWKRWERKGLVGGGVRIAGRKFYRVEDINRMLEEYGRMAPPYPDPDRPGCYRVPLTGSKIRRREAIIDAESLPLIEGGRCSLGVAFDGIAYVALYRPDFPIGTPLRRVIMGVKSAKQCVSHANGDPLDCQRENLIVRTQRQMAQSNRKMRGIKGEPCSSRYKGVTWERQTERWRAQIRANGRHYSLGRFDDEIDAAEAYDEAARKFFGEHAWLNFPEEGEHGLAGEVCEVCDEAQPMRCAAA